MRFSQIKTYIKLSDDDLESKLRGVSRVDTVHGNIRNPEAAKLIPKILQRRGK